MCRQWFVIVVVMLVLVSGCTATTPPSPSTTAGPVATSAPVTMSAPVTTFVPVTTSAGAASSVLRLATTTSTEDSGLLDVILPVFEQQYNARVDVVAVGTGQALAIGAKGDADVLLVHARAREDEFVANGDGINRQDVMYNDFILVGPAADPAGIKNAASAVDALKAIAAAGAPFASRGDDSGTHTKELGLWSSAGITPTVDNGWYFSLGQGMGETLTFANEKGAYTLSDRATFLAQSDNLPDLAILFGGATIAQNPDKTLYNPYGVIAVNPEKHPGVNAELANQFIDWIISFPAQQLIVDFGRDEFGQSLFNPSSPAWKEVYP